MNDADIDLRRRTYAFMIDNGRAPHPEELGARQEILAGWRRLHDAHALVLTAAGDGIQMLNPLSAVPTAYRVQALGRWWYANCAWDAIGVCAALHADGRIETSCPDCGEPIALTVHDGQPDGEDLLFHVLVPARHWWDDIAFT
jgi:alkylmercury lyase-like protein